MKFKWSDKFSLGISKIDEQHQYLFSLGNEIEHISLAESKQSVMKLFNYINNHFKDEEEYQKEIGFPLFKSHRDAHNNLITKFNSIIEKKIETEEDLEEFKLFLYRWLVDHIVHEDMKIRNFIK